MCGSASSSPTFCPLIAFCALLICLILLLPTCDYESAHLDTSEYKAAAASGIVLRRLSDYLAPRPALRCILCYDVADQRLLMVREFVCDHTEYLEVSLHRKKG